MLPASHRKQKNIWPDQQAETVSMTDQNNNKELEALMAETLGVRVGPHKSWDPVNQPMIRHWAQAMGDQNPMYTDPEYAANSSEGSTIAPPTMLQAWTMRGVTGQHAPGTRERTAEQPYVLDILDEYGFVGVVAVNCDQEYFRTLKPGDDISHYMEIESISEKKDTALGTGYFVTELWTFVDQNEEKVGEMRFRLLKFIPPKSDNKPQSSGSSKPKKAVRPRPGINRDNRFFWEGLKEGKLLIQRCKSCETLRHPPSPMCPSCRSLERDAVEASGNGVIHSFVNLHHPALPAFDEPNPIALVELEEGTRLVAGLVGIEPEDVKIGMAVKAEITQCDEELTLALFRPVEA